jgi:hypothetical protein
MVEVQTIGIVVTAISVSLAAIYYTFTLRINMKTQQLALKSQEQTLETRQTQFFMQIYIKYLEDDLFGKNYWILMKREWDTPADYFQKFGTIPEKETDGGDLNKMMTFYEGVAVLVGRRMIDVGLVYELMPTNVTTFWAKFEPVILYLRANRGTPNLYVLVEGLSKRITDYAVKRGDPVVTQYNPIGRGG